jgi:adenine specific DNA methylase Mod
MANKEKKVSFKTPEVLNNAKSIYESLKETRNFIELMPNCGIKKSLMISQEPYEKKINAIVKKEMIAKALSAIRKNPELINSFPDDVKASFAVDAEVTVEPIIDAEKVGANVKKSSPKKK